MPTYSHLSVYFSMKFLTIDVFLLLAHLSRRLTGELIGYPWIRRPSSSSSSVHPSSVHIFKPLLLRNRLANQSQILCGASLGRGNEICINGPGHMTKMAAMPIYGKNLTKPKVVYIQKLKPNFLRNYCAFLN